MTGAPSASTAVMARRAPAVVESDGALQALYRQIDYYPTPPWAARAGAELVLSLDPDARHVWEPACGAGHMAAPLGECFDVRASDIFPHGYGEELDFLTGDASDDDVDWVITNPPFVTADAFLRRGLQVAKRGVALLLRLAFLEGGARYPLLHGAVPLTLCAPFAERVPMTLGRWDPTVASATAYAWFVWMKGAAPQPLRGIPPGTKKRLMRADDAERFGWRAESAMLDMMGGAAA